MVTNADLLVMRTVIFDSTTARMKVCAWKGMTNGIFPRRLLRSTRTCKRKQMTKTFICLLITVSSTLDNFGLTRVNKTNRIRTSTYNILLKMTMRRVNRRNRLKVINRNELLILKALSRAIVNGPLYVTQIRTTARHRIARRTSLRKNRVLLDMDEDGKLTRNMTRGSKNSSSISTHIKRQRLTIKIITMNRLNTRLPLLTWNVNTVRSTSGMNRSRKALHRVIKITRKIMMTKQTNSTYLPVMTPHSTTVLRRRTIGQNMRNVRVKRRKKKNGLRITRP